MSPTCMYFFVRKMRGLNVASFDVEYGKKKGKPRSMDMNSTAGFLSGSYDVFLN